jgi:hypothetical protein
LHAAPVGERAVRPCATPSIDWPKLAAMWYSPRMFEYIFDQARQLLDNIRQETTERGLMPLLEPVAPFNQSPLLLPIVIAGSLISLIFLSGLAIGAFATLFTALLALYLLLSEVFGVSLEFHPFQA